MGGRFGSSVAQPGVVPPSKAVPGLPRINYHLPVVVTLLAALLVLVVLGLLTLAAILNALTMLNMANEGAAGGSYVGAGTCGLVGLAGLGGIIFFVIAVWKGIRDLGTPVQYTRGTVLDKRSMGGRKVGNWLGIAPSYVGPDLQVASAITDEQEAVSVDRSRIFKPRGEPPDGGSGPRSRQRAGGEPSYLPAHRISSSAGSQESPGRPGEGTDQTGEAEAPRVVFRIDPTSYQELRAGEEVIVAHSRFLEHIFYVARLRDGEWESYRNKALI